MPPKPKNKTVVAHTSKGTIRGKVRHYNDGKNKYCSFKHVPYAQIPIGDLRFANPEEIQSFKDVKHCKPDDPNRKRCHEEDQLFVHIHTPEVRPDKSNERYLRPVIVYIPSFPPDECAEREFGPGPEYLMAEDVVLVVLYHRNDILGFTSSTGLDKELNISGVAGLQDIVKGFEFVKREIRHFGGCPDNITAYGQGLSCAYIRWLTVEPINDEFFPPYFHKMILSSSMEHDIKLLQPYQYDLRHVARSISRRETFDDDKAYVEYLRTVAYEELINYSNEMYLGENQVQVVRKNNLLFVKGDDYLTKMPVLIGFNSREGLLETPKIPSESIGNSYLGWLLWLSETQSSLKEAFEKAEFVAEFYREKMALYGCHYDLYLEKIETDMCYVIGTLLLATNLAEEMDPENVYLYKFSVGLTLNRTNKDQFNSQACQGAAHGDELGYIFKRYNCKVQKDSHEEAIIKQMTRIWAQFARTGNPNPVTGSTWLPIGQKLTHYFEIGSTDSAYRKFSDLEKARYEFWEEIYDIDFFSGPARASLVDRAQELEENAGRELSENAEKDVTNCSKLDDSKVPKSSYIILAKEEPEGKVVAHTSKGLVAGDIYLYRDFKYYSFQHVPYAPLPVGNLRFAAPKDITSFQDLKRHKLDGNGRYGPEDHLFVHIYTPEVRPKKSSREYTRPVVVFVPGRLNSKAEQFRSEDLYGPQFLLEEDVVLVVLSYRHDILGFTAFEKPNVELDVPIDAGVQDIIQGFRFVKSEIRHFGGCPDNVTAYGQGTGAIYVRRIAAENAEDDLFHKMILSSSMEHAKGIKLPMSNYKVKSLVNRVSKKINAKDNKTCIDVLRKLPIEELLEFDAPLFEQEQDKLFSIEKLQALSTASYKTKMPVLIGYNSLEGLIDPVISNGYRDGLCDVLTWSIAMRQITKNFDYEEGEEIAEKIKGFYKSLAKTCPKVEANLNETVLSDLNYTVGTIALASHFARAMAPENVYLYRFGADLGCNFTSRLYNLKLFNEATHGDELGYIFKTPITEYGSKGSFDDIAIKAMTKLWAQFARTGDPNPEERSGPADEVWKPVGKKLTKCLHINTRSVTCLKIPEAEARRFKFWESLTDLEFFSGSRKIPRRNEKCGPRGRNKNVINGTRRKNDHHHKNKTGRRGR